MAFVAAIEFAARTMGAVVFSTSLFAGRMNCLSRRLNWAIYANRQGANRHCLSQDGPP
jgi:hypothetical protein